MPPKKPSTSDISKDAFAPSEDCVHLWKERFDRLPEDCRNALFFFALYSAPLRLVRIAELCGCLQVEPDPKAKKPFFQRNIIQKYSWPTARAKDCVENLLKAGWIESKQAPLYSCKEVWREQITQFLYESGQYARYADILFPVTGGRHFKSRYEHYYPRQNDRPRTAEDLIRELRHLLIDSDGRAMEELFHYAHQYRETDFPRVVRELLTTRDGFNWLSVSKPETRCRAVQYLLRQCLSLLEPTFDDKWGVLCNMLSEPGCDPATLILILDYALCAGKLDDPNLDKIDGNLGSLLRLAHQTFLSGNYAEASGLYRETIKAAGHLSKTKNATLPFLSGIFHALAELHGGNRLAVLDGAKTAIEKADYASRGIDIHFPMAMQGCWTLIQNIGQRLTGGDPGQLQINTETRKETRPVWLSLLLSAYESVWFNLDPVEAVEKLGIGLPKDCETNFPWVDAEATEVCESLDILGFAKRVGIQKASEFRRKTKTVPLRDFIQPREDWQLWLESLQTLAEASPQKPKKKAAKAAQPKSRLIWRISFEYRQIDFTPCEQKWNARSESWGQEKTITLSRLYKGQGKMAFLTEQDRRICAAIKVTTRSNYYGNGGTDYRFKDNAAREFVGHPLLFSGNSTTRVEMVRSGPEISMEEKKGKLHVSFSPPLTVYHNIHQSGAYGQHGNPDDSSTDFFTIKESPTRIKVIKLSKTEMQIRKILGEKGREFPKQAERSLTALLGKLAAEDLNVKTDAKIEFTDVPEVPCDPKLYLYLSPNGEGLQVDFFVRPLGSDGPAHRTGTGSERILGSVADKNVQTLRDLNEERRSVKEFVARFEAFDSAVRISENQFSLESPGDALQLLSELKDVQTNPKKQAELGFQNFDVYWPQGEKYSVTSTASFGNMNLSFKSLDEWLAAEGSLNIDGDVFELQRLLELLDGDSETRFVKLSDKKFLALTAELRQRLGELKRLSHNKGKSVQIHPLAAAGMEDFFESIPSLQKNAAWKKVKQNLEAAQDYEAPFPKNFVGDLRDYQLDGYSWLARSAKWGVGCCLADDMGLGKTIQALALLLLRADQGPALVVAPTSVCFNWEREAERFAPTLKIKRIQSIGPGGGLTKAGRDKLILSAKKRDVLITSYSLLQQEIDLFAQKRYATVVLDESQAIKNPDSNRAKAACRLEADFRIAMTGTPIENNLLELWSLFRFLNPGFLGSQKMFEDRFVVPVQRDGSAGARRTLRRLVHPFLLRRTKSQVLDELPPRTEIIREIELSGEEAALYEAARKNALSDLEKIKAPKSGRHSGKEHLQILAALTRLRQLCCNPRMILPDTEIKSSKLEAFREIMSELKENRHKVLVFSQFVKHLDILRTELDEMGISYQYLDGSTPVRERQKRVDAFQSGESDAFLISIKAGGSGLNLTVADYVIHTDPWWNPALEDQATDRAHRIGQTRPVTVYRLITKGTIEEKIVRLHHEKRDIADKLLEGTDQATKLTANELIDILPRLLPKN